METNYKNNFSQGIQSQLPFFLILILCACFSACSNIKYLPEGEKLYIGSKVKIESAQKISGKKTLAKKLNSLTSPLPNSCIFGFLRPKLWFYNIAGHPSKNKGFRYWLKNKVGEPPVFLSTVKTGVNEKVIEAKAFNSGYFKSSVTSEVKERHRKATIVYKVSTQQPYKIKEVNFPADTDPLDKAISDTKKKTFLLPKSIYDLDVLKKERTRIDEQIKEKGYFYFNPDYLVFQIDSTKDPGLVTVNLRLKEEISDKAFKIYRINNVFITDDYTLTRDTTAGRSDTVRIDSTFYITSHHEYRRRAIVKTVYLKKGLIYNRHDQNMTLSRLMGLGSFKFATIKFTDLDSIMPGNLDAHVYLTPLQRRSIRLELQGITKSDNYAGPNFKVSYRDRNALRGSELFTVNLQTSYEIQFGRNASGLNSFEIGPTLEMYLPRLLIPFRIKKPTSYFIPKTKFSFGYDFLKRAQFFNSYSFKFNYGYKWKDNLLVDQELDPVVINFVSFSQKSPEFIALLNTNPILKISFEEQFIVGATYSYTYNEQLIPEKKDQVYFNGNIDESGNTLYMLSKAVIRKTGESGSPYMLAGSPFSQYSRVDVDFRNYYNFDKDHRLVFRQYAGFGRAYGNSVTLPYLKQFFSGGTTSIRAFAARTLGPGTYYTPDSIRATIFFEQGGDIKIEDNIEYRFGIVSILKGALFADAGNIWLVRDNPLIPGGKISKNFYREIAVGTGFGLRIDANFFVLRFDLSFPLRKPWLPENQRWVINQISFGSSAWRHDNLILNIAIGYPF